MQKLLLFFSVLLCFGAIAASVYYFDFPPVKVDIAHAAPATATCQTGFAKPLLFGISPDGSPSAYEGELKNAGSTISTVGLNWDYIQKDGPNNYDPEMVNFPIRKAAQAGLVVVVNLSGTPRWASDNTNLGPEDAQPNRANETVKREFRELVSQAVRDNKDKVKYWTYWNEPNGCMSSLGSCGSTPDTAEEFAYWHNYFYDIVKENDPTAKVILGNLEFVKNDTSYIGWLNDIGMKYDYLGVNVYKKEKNQQFPIDWVKAAYDKQKDKKPIWLNEWGFDSKWWGCGDDSACVDRARQEIAGLVDDGFKKIIAADYIIAAQYHNLRDRDGNYGLWSSNGPRPAGVKFKEIVDRTCNPSFSNNPPASPIPSPVPPSEQAICLSSSNNLSGNALLPRQQVTFTSLASKPIKSFYFNFYNPNNKDANGIPKPFCVTGPKMAGFENDGCPAGTAQYRELVNGQSSTASQGSIQAFDLFKFPNNKVRQSVWMGNTGWTRNIDFGNDLTNTNPGAWTKGQTLDQVMTTPDSKPNQEINAIAIWLDAQNVANAEIWKNNIAYYNSATIGADGVSFAWKGNWQVAVDLNANPVALPGTGVVTARSNVVVGDKLWQTYWRGNTEWRREAPLRNGLSPDFSQFNNLPNKGYVMTRTLEQLGTTVKGSGFVQAIDHTLLANGSLLEVVWRGNQASARTITVSNGKPNWDSAGQYTYPNISGNLPANENATSVTVNYEKLAVPDKQVGANNQIPERLQINATFVAEDGKFIDNHGSCVSSILLRKTIAGDVTGDCNVDIYDYNALVQNFEKTDCSLNLTGDCRIDSQDIEELKKQFGKTCNVY